MSFWSDIIHPLKNKYLGDNGVEPKERRSTKHQISRPSDLTTVRNIAFDWLSMSACHVPYI